MPMSPLTRQIFKAATSPSSDVLTIPRQATMPYAPRWMTSESAGLQSSSFSQTLPKHDTVMTEFDPEAWHSLVDFVTVYGVEDIRFTFKNGKEI